MGVQERMGVRHSSSLASPLIALIRGHPVWKALRYTADQQRGDDTLPGCLNALWLEKALTFSFAFSSE